MLDTGARLAGTAWFGQLFRYGLIGVTTNALGYAVYLLATHLGATPKLTMSVLYVLGTIVSFFCNRRLTFAHEGSRARAGIRFVVAHVFGYLLNLAILVVMVDRLGFAHQWVQAGAILVVAGFLFLAFKFFVFAHAERAGEDQS